MTAACSALGGLLGSYAGKVISTLYAQGGKFANALNKSIAKTIAKFTGGAIQNAGGKGYTIKIKKLTLRIMTSSKARNNYMRLSMQGKGTKDVMGEFTTDRAKTHINITACNMKKKI